MDPQATWNALLDAWTQRDWQEVVDLAEALLEWIRKGGFPPKTTPGRQMGADWNHVLSVAACKFALGRASNVLASPGNIPTEVPFTLSCAECNNEGPPSYGDALAAGWKRLIYTPAGLSENFLGVCPQCSRAEDSE
jgi:hypothetical protein